MSNLLNNNKIVITLITQIIIKIESIIIIVIIEI